MWVTYSTHMALNESADSLSHRPAGLKRRFRKRQRGLGTHACNIFCPSACKDCCACWDAGCIARPLQHVVKNTDAYLSV